MPVTKGGRQGLGEFDEWEQDLEKVPDLETDLGIPVGAPGAWMGLWVSGLWRGGQWTEAKLRGRRELMPWEAERIQVASVAKLGEGEVGVVLTAKGFSGFLEKQ